jgi:fibronectin type 3 domain-containing protein
VAQIRPADLKNVANGRATYTDQIPADEQSKNPTASVFYAVSVVNSYGRSAGLSNGVEVPAAPALPPPSDFRVSVSADGIACEWSPGTIPDIPGLRFSYRVYRREGGSAKDSVAGEIPASPASTTFVDHTFEWEKTYQYRATIVTYVARDGTELQVEGDDSSPANLVAHDIFPPAVPSGLQAVFSGPGQRPAIDLVWAPNTEPDLAGYNIYRQEGSGAPAKINSELVKSPAHRDAEIVPGHSYTYSVSAVDVRGNESGPSEEASEAVPGQ